MRGILHAILIASIASAAHISAACERPDDIELPNGKTASEADMLAADQDYRKFMDSMRAYQDCLAAESDQSRPSGQDKNSILQHENAFVARHNAASDAMTRVTDKFNEEIDEYKSRQ